MVSLGAYLFGVAQLAAVVLSLAFAAYRLRQRLLPDWAGAPARLVEIVTAVALLTWLAKVLGTFALFYAGPLIAACLLLLAVVLWRTQPRDGLVWTQTFLPAGGVGAGVPRGAEARSAEHRRGGRHDRTRGQCLWGLATLAVISTVTAHWAITTKHALDRGIFNFDSLWYHMPFSVEMVQSHSLTGMHHVDTVFTNWFYPQNSELLHAVGILLTDRDTLSLFLNFGWLGVAFLAAWCIGRPYGRAPLSLAAAAILLECHTLVVREPGAAKNDLAAAALLLAAIAILITARTARNRASQRAAVPLTPDGAKRNHATASSPPDCNPATASLPLGWSLAAAGLALGLAAGTKVTVLAPAAALSVAVLIFAPAGRRGAAAAWWFLPALLGGGYWYLRNLIVAGNPIPEIESLGPISLPHPERLQVGRPDFSIVHYGTDSGVWSQYFAPGLHDAFGALWPLVLLAAVAAALLAVVRGRDAVVRCAGGVALFGMLAYLFTPLSAAGAEGEPVGFAINVRFVVPALLVAIVLLPLPLRFDRPPWRWGLLAALLIVLVASDRPDAVLRDPARVFALAFVALLVLAPAALWLARQRGLGKGALLAGSAALAVAVVAIGYPVQRDYLRERFRNEVAAESIPGMGLDSAYRWARRTSDARIGLVGTTAGFAQYGFYGTDLSNEVRYLGVDGPHGAFNAIATCKALRSAVNAADLDYLVTAPFLNFIHPDRPIASPEGRWLRGDPAITPVRRGRHQVTVWRVRGTLVPSACRPRNAPLREIPGRS